MIINESFVVPAPVDEVAQFFLDVQRVSACVPGVGDVQPAGEGRYTAMLRVQMGPIRSQFAGEITLDDSEAPQRLRATGQGKDRATGSQAQVSFTAELTATDEGHTRVDAVADVTIRGRLGQFGTGVITSTAKSMVREFADCAGQTLRHADSTPPDAAAGGDGDTAPVRSPAAAPQAASLGRVVRRGLWLYVVELVRKLGAMLRGRKRRDSRDGTEGRP